jgi:CPA1 family monovalent cation:H+ antiporter
VHPIEAILVLLVAASAMALVATRVGVPYALMLVIGGLALGFVPGLPRVTLEPQYVFVLFLPPLLYYAALQTSWRDFRANIRPISTLAFGLTLFTTAAVAVIAKWLIPEFTWPTAFVLGAIVSPPDAVAATAVAERLHVPKRIVTILEGESLLNDAAAIVAYRIAIAATLAAGTFSLGNAAVRFLLVGAGGVIVGWVAGWMIAWVRPKIRDVSVETAFSLLTPYVAYLPAEHLGVSGVLAVVTTGLYLSRRYPRIVAPAARLRAYAVWDTLVFILNCLVFILIGLQLPAILERLKDETSLRRLIAYAAVVSLATVLVRVAWVFPAAVLSRMLTPSSRRDEPMPPMGQVFVVAWTGMRGIVSLAAALALPMTLRDNSPFPNRDLILFLTFCVICVTLLAQGLTLPWIIRRLGVQEDGSQDREEEVTARYLSALAAIERLDALTAPAAATPNGNEAAIARVRAEYEQRIGYYSARLADPTLEDRDDDCPVCQTVEEAHREALAAERRMLVRLRDDGVIGDEILRRVQHQLDLEESQLDA